VRISARVGPSNIAEFFVQATLKTASYAYARRANGRYTMA
jgi:hypothetical protein